VEDSGSKTEEVQRESDSPAMTSEVQKQRRLDDKKGVNKKTKSQPKTYDFPLLSVS